jgi:hypothetical protein
MLVADALKNVREVEIRSASPEVFRTAARAIACRASAAVVERGRHQSRRAAGVLPCWAKTADGNRNSARVKPQRTDAKAIFMTASPWTTPNKSLVALVSCRYFGDPAVSERPCRLSAPSSRMV